MDTRGHQADLPATGNCTHSVHTSSCPLWGRSPINTSALTPFGTPPLKPSPLAPFPHTRYKIKKLIGEGGRKRVYRAHDASLGRDVALALSKAKGADTDIQVRTIREAQVMSRLRSHRRIVAITDLGALDGQPYIAMELLNGGTLADLIYRTPGKRLSFEEAIRIIVDVCEGVAFAHENGVLHQDLNPSNIWLDVGGEVKIGDFGSAVLDGHSVSTQPDRVAGTMAYLAPERIVGRNATIRSDLYSLGTTIYEMVTRVRPFTGDTISLMDQHINSAPISPCWHRPDLPRAFEKLILGLLSKDPGKRPESAEAVASGLRSIPGEAHSRRPIRGQDISENGPGYRHSHLIRDSVHRAEESI